MRHALRVGRGPFGQLLLIIPIVAALAACAGGEVGQKQEQGETIGSMIGDMLGSIIPGGNSVAGQVAVANAGTIGGLIGGAIGAALDEEDRKALEKATRASFDSGKTHSFASKRTGVRGKVTVTSTRTNTSGQQCRTVKQEVNLKDGRTLSDNVSACKHPEGWRT
jgi:surface antigen